MVFSNMFLMHGRDIILTFILTSYLEGECSPFESSVGARKVEEIHHFSVAIEKMLSH